MVSTTFGNSEEAKILTKILNNSDKRCRKKVCKLLNCYLSTSKHLWESSLPHREKKRLDELLYHNSALRAENWDYEREVVTFTRNLLHIMHTDSLRRYNDN